MIKVVDLFAEETKKRMEGERRIDAYSPTGNLPGNIMMYCERRVVSGQRNISSTRGALIYSTVSAFLFLFRMASNETRLMFRSRWMDVYMYIRISAVPSVRAVAPVTNPMRCRSTGNVH